jgi:hypothetical protein
MNKKTSATTIVLWVVFIGLLLVLLPHTAWLFRQFEPAAEPGKLDWGWITAGAAAFAFEASIAVLIHKLAKHIEDGPKRFPSGPKRFTDWPKIKYRYVNSYFIGLVLALSVSTLANLAHSVEFGKPLAIFTAWGIQAKVYQIAFGGVLPVVSLLFARVLSNVSESEDIPNPELEAANAQIKELRSKLKEAGSTITEYRRIIDETEQRAHDADERFAAAGELFARLFNEEKRQRIMAARQTWPELPASAVAIIAGCSPSYVSEVINEVKA